AVEAFHVAGVCLKVLYDDVIVIRHQGGAHVTAEENFGFGVVEMKVAGRVEKVRGNELQGMISQHDRPTLVLNGDEIFVKFITEVTDKTFPQPRHINFGL